MTPFDTRIHPASEAFQNQRAGMLALIEQLHALQQRASDASARAAAGFAKRGALLPRERLNRLLDPGRPFLALCNLAGYGMDHPDLERCVPGGSQIAGIGFVSGVRCMVVVTDSGIDAGALTEAGNQKLMRCQDIALENKLPFVHLVESAGSNLRKYRVDKFIRGGGMFYNLARLSAAGLPVITVVHGSITAGGILSLPKTVFKGGALVGCDAGFLNASRIKGSHAAIKTGMLAAEAAFAALKEGRAHDELRAYPKAFEESWLFKELDRARNFKQWFKKGRGIAMLMTGIEQWLLPKVGLKAPPWTLHRKRPDHTYLQPAADCPQIIYPKPDGKLSFDRLSSVFISNTNHEENQPAHLTLRKTNVPVAVNLARFAGPESRYCPAGVYEFVKNENGFDRLQINAQNCVHCKTCDIKDPTQNIAWVSPEGGGGPNYADM